MHHVVKYWSPSAIETWMLCPRKWALTKIDRHPKITGKGAELGVQVHAQHEAYLTHGTPYDLQTRAGFLASRTINLIPLPGVATIEAEVTFPFEGLIFGGKLDAHWRAGTPIVLDHKTTGAIGYAKIERHELLEHPQAPIYAVWATRHYDAESVELRWNYIETKPQRPDPVTSWHHVSRADALSAFAPFVPIAHDMARHLELANTGELANANAFPAHDGKACRAFGGCQFYRKECLATASHQSQRSNYTMGDFDINSFLNDVAAKSGQGPVAPVATVAQTAAAAVVSDVPAVITAPAVVTLHDGPAINPPESLIVVAPVVAEAPPVNAPARRGRKPKAPSPPIEPPAGEPKLFTATENFLLGSILQGLCANPGLSFMPPSELADRAIAIADEVTS